VRVFIKRIDANTPEVGIAQFLSSEELRSDPANHCVPVLDVIPDSHKPGKVLLVMPLFRPYNDPPFDKVGEIVDFLRQMLEGLEFMHRHHVAHRDGASLNVMMDPGEMFPEGFHPRRIHSHPTEIDKTVTWIPRSATSVKYYFIDFGISVRFDNMESRGLVRGRFGREKTTPELVAATDETLYDPFPVDIYVAGKLIETNIEDVNGLKALDSLVARMIARDPKARPAADECLSEYLKLSASLRKPLLESKPLPRQLLLRWRAQFLRGLGILISRMY